MANCAEIHNNQYRTWCEERKFDDGKEGAIVHTLNALMGVARQCDYDIREAGGPGDYFQKRLKEVLEDMRIILDIDNVELIYSEWLEENRDDDPVGKWREFKQAHGL